MIFLLALVPALCWGSVPLIEKKVANSKVTNQVLGQGLGAALIGILVTIFWHGSMNLVTTLWALFSGICWSIGQIGQFISLNKIGVSKAVPISTGFQLIGNTLIGAVIFGEWQRPQQYLLGSIALIMIIAGIALTAVNDKSKRKKVAAQDILFLLVTAAGFWGYSAFPKAIRADAQLVFMPQMIGFCLGIIIYILIRGQAIAFKEKATWLDLSAGIIWGLGGLIYIIVAPKIGVTVAFILGQQAMVISTIGGMLILHEYKHGRELWCTLIGLVMIIFGAILVSI